MGEAGDSHRRGPQGPEEAVYCDKFPEWGWPPPRPLGFPGSEVVGAALYANRKCQQLSIIPAQFSPHHYAYLVDEKTEKQKSNDLFKGN